MAGADRNYRPASAKIDGNSVLVSNPEVPEPRYVRYGWKDVPVMNLYNNAGLPGSPFSSEALLPGLNQQASCYREPVASPGCTLGSIRGWASEQNLSGPSGVSCMLFVSVRGFSDFAGPLAARD